MQELDPSESVDSTHTVAKSGGFWNSGIFANSVIRSNLVGTINNHYYGTEEETTSPTLDWLSSLEYERKQRHFVERRAPNTGQWLLNSKEFTTWHSKETHELWCVGMPGAGKTILASIVISHLRNPESRLSHQLPLVAFLYLTYEEQPPLEHLLGSIAKQFLDLSKELPQLLKRLSDQSHQKHPTLRQAHKILGDVTQNRQVYIIVDALDAYPSHLRDDLVDHLRQIKEDVNLFVTSRLFEGIEKTARSFKRLDIVAQNQDIQEYINCVIERHTVLRNSIDRDLDLRTDIGEVVTKKSSKMFLLAKLHMDAIVTQISPYDVRKALEELPESLEDTYKVTMNLIRSQRVEKRTYAILILSWIVWAPRPLSVGEMLHALAVEEGGSYFQNGRMLRMEDIQEWCYGLVVIDEGNTVRLVHYTAQDYLNMHKDAEFPNFRRHIASTCESYVRMLPAGQRYHQSEDEVEDYPFGPYARWYLTYYVRCWSGRSTRTNTRTNSVVNRPSIWARTIGRMRDANGLTAWTANATAGILALLRENVANPNDQDGQGVNILYGAAAGGDVQKVEFLLRQGVDPSLRTKFGWAPLHWAANNGHLDCVRLLLKWKAELSPVSDQGTTPLDQARNSGQDAIADILERAGAETAKSIYAKRRGESVSDDTED